jgi:hypothetical protein
LGRHPGESRGPGHLEILDSGFRRNDENGQFQTFYETIKIAKGIFSEKTSSIFQFSI